MIDVNMEVGLCHPPVGLNLYVASMIARHAHHRSGGGGVAVAAHHAGLPVIVTYWPGLTLWLPRVLGMH